MVPMTKRNVIKPQYYDKFSCIGADCEDNCCKGWRITIDKKTYMKCKNVKNPAFQDKVAKSVRRIRDNRQNEYSYAQFIMDEDKRCPFQTPQGLCEIHRDLGEEYLSNTCRTYPRVTKVMTDGYIEMSLRMSCPEAARIALFEEAPMEFDAQTLEFKENDPTILSMGRPENGAVKTRFIEYGWEMREAAITIMQKRTCSVAHRIIIIAMMLNDVTEAHDEGRADDIPGILDFYSTGEYGAQFLDSFNDFETNDNIRMKMSALLYYTVKELAKQPDGAAFAALLERFEKDNEKIDEHIAGAGFDELLLNSGFETMKFLVFIEQLINAHWGGFLSKWEYVMENYLISFMFTELFPLTYHGKGLNPYYHSFILAEQYALLRILLCVNFDDSEGFTKQFIVRTATKIAVINQHSEKPLQIVENYKAAGIDSPAYLYYLLIS